MGICYTKKGTKEENTDYLTRAGSTASLKSSSEHSLISLDRVKALSSNASSVVSRYHRGSNSQRLRDDYEVFPKKVLGSGLSGNVVLAKGRHDGRRCALKRIQTLRVPVKALRQLVAEVEIYLSLDHPNIARLRDVYETDTEIALVTECCEGGELYARLAKSGTYVESDAAQATRQMLRAVGYLHAHNIVHRDLKLENFLYASDEEDSPLKLIDFGFAKVWDPSTLMQASCGSIAYVSPDVLRGQGYTSKCDLWSIGVIVFMLLAGYPPFHGSEKEMRANILQGKVDYSHTSRWKNVSRDAIDFVRRLLTTDPAERFDVYEALQHTWLSLTQTDGVVQLPKEALRSLRRYAQTSHLRRALLQLLAQELAPDEAQELSNCFLSIDKTNEGTIRLSELKDAIRGSGARHAEASPASASPMSAISPKTPAAKLCRAKSEVLDRLFEVLDANGDEQIYYSDFLAATMDARTHLREETLRAAFHRFDVDRTGRISSEAFRRVLGDTFEGINVELLASEAFACGKGNIDFVEFEDFLRVVEAHDATPTPKARFDAGLDDADLPVY
eukprot:TRINITY_DN14153_c0_g2_i1.p1 TRINITY_DN14153_c0_g2~~TRINITY_DN14153_c0_g2_i1.p1  ORF type:complete len:559 (+),score=105.00 TRINITY_DN14153_c0_g2_i1:215-1891(+)